MEVFTIIMGSLGGVSVVLTGLFAHFGKLRLEKYKSELQKTNNRLQAITDASSHVTKTQFDKEFSIYQDIWRLLVDLRARTLSLRPVMDSVDPNESDEDRMKRRLKDFSDTFYSFRDAIENNRPFYAEGVYQKLGEIFDLCYEESIEYQYKDPGWNREYWDKATKNRERVLQAIDDSCSSIRERIGRLEVTVES